MASTGLAGRVLPETNIAMGNLTIWRCISYWNRRRLQRFLRWRSPWLLSRKMWSYQWLGNSVRSMPLVTTQMTTVMTMLEDALNWTRPIVVTYRSRDTDPDQKMAMSGPIVAPCHFARTPACPGVEGGFRNLDRRARQEPGEESSFGTDDRTLPRKRLTFIGHSTVTLWRRWSRRCGFVDLRTPSRCALNFPGPKPRATSDTKSIHASVDLPDLTYCQVPPTSRAVTRGLVGRWSLSCANSTGSVPRVGPFSGHAADERWGVHTCVEINDECDFGSSLEVSVYLDPGKR